MIEGRAILERAEEVKLSGNDRLVYLHLWILSGYGSETLTIKDSDLHKTLRMHDSTGKPANVRTLATIRARLKLKGFIEFTKKKDGIEYRLTPLQTPMQTPLQTPMQTHSHTINNNINSKETTTTTATAATAGAKGVLQAWQECTGESAKGGVAIGLNDLAKLYGEDRAIAAVYEADRYNSRERISFNLVKRIAERMHKKDSSERQFRTSSERMHKEEVTAVGTERITEQQPSADVSYGWGINRRPPRH